MDRSVWWTPPRLGGVEVARERKFLAWPEGWTLGVGGGLIENNRINSITYDVVEGGIWDAGANRIRARGLTVGEIGQIEFT